MFYFGLNSDIIPKEVNFMKDAVRVQLGDNIFLNIINTDKFKTNVLTFAFRSRLSSEEASVNALIGRVLVQGCNKYKDIEELGNRLSDLYGADLQPFNVKRGNSQEIGLSVSFISNKYALKNEDILNGAVEILFDVLLDPLLVEDGFKEEYCETEKINQIDLIKSEINNKVTYARNRCIEIMCKNDDYGVSEKGEIDKITALTPSDIYKGYQRLLKSAPIEMFIIGNEDNETVIQKIKPYISSIKRENVNTIPRTTIFTGGLLKEEIEEMDVTQGKLTLGFKTGIPRYGAEYPALCLFNAVYGMTPNSKLFMNVREKLSLCYYCRSDIIPQKGIMIVSSGIEIENKDRAFNEIMLQLENIKNGEVSDEEFDVAKKAFINSFKSSFDSPSMMINWYMNEIIDNTDNDKDDFIEKIRSVTKEDVIRVSDKIVLDTIYFLKNEAKGAK